MAYREIDLGTPNSNNGDDARVGGSKINENAKELFSRSFKRDNWIVTRWSYDPGNLQFDAWLDEDKIEGWYDVNDKKRWISGLILVATGINLPVDIDDPSKFLKLTDKEILT